ncbi:efflux RND transporter periplasmic adaptor subunit [Rhodocyclus purpureus]|uniref:efflux RND transporter periplasmic adaptor subunit n=1 Tax=Rhodocyclus purpureus TaxID=1067 RepID=UPI001F5CDF20|nr:efflux RND transporter periplasmic adaptor subunit [Rhodocyclus purpureus]
MTVVLVLVAALAAAGGYRLGSAPTASPAGEAANPAAPGSAAPPGQRKILFYRNPMGLPDTSPTPKKDPMGMDYIPVYADEEEGDAAATGRIRISTEKVQKLGVRSEVVSLRPLGKEVRAVGRIEADERRVYAIAPKFEGYVERLHANATGQLVRRGQPLFEVYSPELVSAQREYAIAAEGADRLQGSAGEAAETTRRGMWQLAESSLSRLRNWDIPEAQIKALARSGAAQRTLTVVSPVSGVVTEKKAVQGMRFGPGEALYQIADLSSVWVIAEVAEQDIGVLRNGAKATVTTDAYPGKTLAGTIGYIYPMLNAQTRTAAVRIELANPGTLLKPGMFAQVQLATADSGPVLTVPISAVIDSGKRQLVFVELGAGRYEPREVRLGARGDEYVQVLAGVREGESVVVAANFLIDAESKLKAAVAGFARPDEKTDTKPAAVGHQTVGKVEEVDAKAGTASISHEPIASLKWPAMTMEFKAANDAIFKALKPGSVVAFEFVERGQGEWVVTRVGPVKAAAGAASAEGARAGAAGTNAHAGH